MVDSLNGKSDACRQSVTIRRYDIDGNFITAYTYPSENAEALLKILFKHNRTDALMCVNGEFVVVPPTKRTNVMVRDKGGRLVKWKHLLSS